MLCLHNCGHKGDNEEHLCSGFHKCIETCELNGKDNKCNEECSLPYGPKITTKIIIQILAILSIADIIWIIFFSGAWTHLNKLIIVLRIVFIKKNQGIVLKIKNADYSINMMEIVIVVQINIYVNINEVKEVTEINVVYYLNIKKIMIVNKNG
jgi:hypothetical protein